MKHVLLIQLPIPKLNYGMKTGNIPLGAACLKQAASHLPEIRIDIVPESTSSYLSDSALLSLIETISPDIIGFSVFSWNVERSLYISECIKKKSDIKIILGGPEVTPDNHLVKKECVDFLVYGEGEKTFIRLLTDETVWDKKSGAECSESLFKEAVSPYLSDMLEPQIQNLMLLETQRGCPYHCGFCYYNKSRSCVTFKEESKLLDGLRWAVDHSIDELYLLDPSLNARPDLKNTLRKMADINFQKTVSINSEIRAEWIDDELADLFYDAGFTGFEIGLQTTNKHALKLMRRPTSLKKFVKGATLLKEREILPRIDLISGLPGDDLTGFNRSIGFVAEHNLDDDVQVFPLSVLPGTDFRKNSRELGITYEQSPPYTVLETETFSKEDMLLSFDYAESLFDVTLFPLPDLDISWKRSASAREEDVKVTIDGRPCISKLVLNEERSYNDIEWISKHLTFPYQILIKPGVKNNRYIFNVLKILTLNNPYTPLEIVFIEPGTLPDTDFLLSAIQLKRPHFLDNDLRYLYGTPGNRAVLFTLVSPKENLSFSGDMKRQVFHWTRNSLPEPSEIDDLSDFDGILINSGCSDNLVIEWQQHFAPSINYIPLISFSDIECQKNWMKLTAEDEYYFDAFSSW